MRGMAAVTESTTCWRPPQCRLSDVELRAHFLDSRGLLFELGHQNLYLFLLLGDLLQFASELCRATVPPGLIAA